MAETPIQFYAAYNTLIGSPVIAFDISSGLDLEALINGTPINFYSAYSTLTGHSTVQFDMLRDFDFYAFINYIYLKFKAYGSVCSYIYSIGNYKFKLKTSEVKTSILSYAKVNNVLDFDLKSGVAYIGSWASANDIIEILTTAQGFMANYAGGQPISLVFAENGKAYIAINGSAKTAVNFDTSVIDAGIKAFANAQEMLQLKTELDGFMENYAKANLAVDINTVGGGDMRYFAGCNPIDLDFVVYGKAYEGVYSNAETVVNIDTGVANLALNTYADCNNKIVFDTSGRFRAARTLDDILFGKTMDSIYDKEAQHCWWEQIYGGHAFIESWAKANDVLKFGITINGLTADYADCVGADLSFNVCDKTNFTLWGKATNTLDINTVGSGKAFVNAKGITSFDLNTSVSNGKLNTLAKGVYAVDINTSSTKTAINSYAKANNSLDFNLTAKSKLIIPQTLSNLYDDVVGTAWYSATMQSVFYNQTI